MRKPMLLLSIFAFALPALSGSLAEVTLPDSATVGGKTLQLNGLGLRKKMMFKVYVGGLYLEKKSGDAAAIIAADAPKRVVTHFIYSEVSKAKMVEAYSEGFKNNAAAQMGALKARIDQFLGALDTMKEGEEMSVTYLPSTGTTLAIRGKDVLTVPGLDFAKALFSVWLGASPPTEDLKKGMLGKS
jgi:hypothetical protein